MSNYEAFQSTFGQVISGAAVLLLAAVIFLNFLRKEARDEASTFEQAVLHLTAEISAEKLKRDHIAHRCIHRVSPVTRLNEEINGIKVALWGHPPLDSRGHSDIIGAIEELKNNGVINSSLDEVIAVLSDIHAIISHIDRSELVGDAGSVILDIQKLIAIAKRKLGVDQDEEHPELFIGA